MTRILHIITMLELGGAQQNTLATCAHFQGDGLESFLAAGPGGVLDPEARDRLGERFLPVGSLTRPIHPWKDLAAVRELRALVRRLRPDVVHTHSSKAGILGRRAARAEAVPRIIHTVHGFPFHPHQFWPARALYRRLERRAARHTDDLVFVSADDREEARRLGITPRGATHLIRSGIPLERYAFDADARQRVRAELGIGDRFMILTLACLKPQKDPETWARTAVEIGKTAPDRVMVLAGDGVLRPRVERIVGPQLGKSVWLLGWREDVPALLSAADAFYLPSRWEGLPRAILQALACGLPVVASDIPGNRETGGLGPVVLVPPGKPAAHATALVSTRKTQPRPVANPSALGPFSQDAMFSALARLYRPLSP